MDTMTLTKVVGSLCGALLVMMLGAWAAETIYHVGSDGHGDGHGDELHAAYIIEVDDAGDTAVEEEGPDVAALIAAADIGKGEKVFSKCKSCHALEEGKNGTGPSLYGVVGRDIAAFGDFKYSGTLAGLDGDWTAQELFDFLGAPKKYAPGTTMGFAGLKKETDRANLIAWLDSLDD